MDNNTERRRSSASSVDREKLTRLREMKLFNQGKGGFASKLLKSKAKKATDESAASALTKAMTRKKGGEALQLQIEIETDAQWKLLLRREGLIIAEVYAGWSGPCVSMVNILKKVKVDANDDRLTLATVNSDNIPDLKVFKNQSEPAWIFMGGGKPVKLMRGANAPKLIACIKSEFQYELLCMEGKAKRHLICITDEVERKQLAETEAIRLAVVDKPVSPTEEHDEVIEGADPDDSERKPLTKSSDDDFANESKRRESNVRLMGALEKYTVIAIQGFLLETGAVTEIKDHLKEDFKIIQERYIYLQEDGVRYLFGIPYEVPEVVEDTEETLHEDGESEREEGQHGQHEGSSEKELLKVAEHPDRPESRASEHTSTKEESNAEIGDNDPDDPENYKEIEIEEPKVIMVPVPLPDELVGDTLLFLLESNEMRKLMEQDGYEKPLLYTADDYIRLKVGPEDFKDALDNAPDSLHALYGREEYAAGVWCPRKYDDKRYVMLNFFPRFVTEMLMPPPKECPKYILAIFPALFANEIMDHPELINNQKDILAQGKMTIPMKMVERMLKSRGFEGQDLEAKKKALTGFDMFAVAVDESNPELSAILATLEPIHMSVDNENGIIETAKLFPHLNILIDDEDEDNRIMYRDLIVETFISRSKSPLETILDSESNSNIDDRTTSTSLITFESPCNAQELE